MLADCGLGATNTPKNVLQCFDVTHEAFQKFKDDDRN